MVLPVSPTWETVDARGDGALVGQVSGDAPFVLCSSTSDESRVEDESVLGGVTTSFQGSEKETPFSQSTRQEGDIFTIVILAKQLPLMVELECFFLKKWISQRHDQATNLYYLGQTFLPWCCEWLLRLRVHLGKRDHPRGKKSFPQSPCSAPAQPCHHCSHWFPQQGGGAPVPEQGLFCPQDLYCRRRVLGQVCETPGVRDQTSSNLKSRANLASARHSTHEIRYKRTIHKHMRTISTGFCVITMAQWIDRFWYNIIGPRL